MIEVKNSFLSGLDLDTSLFQLRKDSYIDALNVTRDAVEGNQDLVITNIVGNRIVSYSYPGRTIYINDDSFFTGRLLNNGDGTQAMTLVFGTISVGITAVNLQYYDGAVWTTVSGGTTSPQQYTMPEGSYTYRVVTVSGGGDAVYPLTTSTVYGVGKVIGAYPNTLRNTVVFMRYDSELCHGVYEYDKGTGTITKILQNLSDSNNVDVLGFTADDKITSIAIYNKEDGDLLYFLDSLKRPTTMDITLFKASAYNPVTRDIINAAKNPPLSPPLYIYSNDTTYRSNNLLNKFFRFIYRFVYDDNTKSSWSPVSSVIVPTKILDPTYANVITNNNAITLSITSGAKNVKYVEIGVSVANKSNTWEQFGLVESIDKSKNSISDDITFPYTFYNDGTYPLIDLKDTNELFYWMPDEANSMILANGNVLVFGGITEGYNRTLSPNVVTTINTLAVGTGGNVGSLNGVLNFNLTPATNQAGWITFSGVPAVGTVIRIRLKRISDNAIVTAATYTTVPGDTIGGATTGVIGGLIASANSLAVLYDARVRNTNELNIAWRADFSGVTPRYYGDFLEFTITQPTVSTDTSSIPTWKWSTTRRLGIVYYDKRGKTNGVMYDTKVSFPAYAENGSHQVLIPYINVKIYHQPPDWAYSYQFVVTKEPTSYLFWESVSVNTSETDYIYFEVTNFDTNDSKNPTTSTVLSYTFQGGDRLRLIRRMSDQTVFNDTYDVAIDGLLTEPKINGVVQTGKKFLKVKKVAPLSTVNYASNNFVFEIYRPGHTLASATLEPFFEFGYQFSINNPTQSTRTHGGNVTDQTTDYVTPAESNLYNGDSYFRLRQIYLTDTGVGSFYVQDRNVVDFYISAVSSVDGRPSIIDVNAKRQYFGALLRFGQAYQANTNINGLNAFYGDDFQDVDYSLGSIRRMVTRERFIRVFQDYKIGMIPLFSQINKSTSGDVLVQTDSLLNPIQYYAGNFGIGTASESLTSYNNADYGCDNSRGVIWRVSTDGITVISVLYKINSWATDKLPLRKGNYKIYGGYDPKSNNYIAALEATDDDSAYTISFDEETNVFESFLSYHPEMIVTLGTLMVTFKNGNLYTHDNPNYNTFYGTTYESNLTPVFNEKSLEKKTWLGLNEISNTKWDCPLIYSNAMSFGTQRQETNLVEDEFKSLESNFAAPIKRDIWSRGGKYNGAVMKGNYLAVKFRKQNATNLITLNLISAKFIDSPLST